MDNIVNFRLLNSSNVRLVIKRICLALLVRFKQVYN